MTLFAIALLISLILWVAAAIPGSRVPEYVPRFGFFLTALVWVVGQ